MRRVRLAARSQAGLTLVELIVTMAILLVVMVSISATFVSGTHSEANVEHRLQTQTDSRLALTKMRQDVHCASDVQSVGQASYDSSGHYDSTGAGPSKGFQLSLTEFYGTCKSVDFNGTDTSKVQLLWCTVPQSVGGTTIYDLYRGNTTCDTTSTLVVQNIVAPSSGWPTNSIAGSPTSWNGNIWPDVSNFSGVSPGTCTDDYLKTLPIDMALNVDLNTTPTETYELKDNIALRNSTRCGTTSGGSSSGQARTTLSLSVPGAMIKSTTMAASSIVATLSGSSSPTSQITFYRSTSPSASAPSTCAGSSWTTVGTATPTGDGNWTPSGAGFSPGTTTGTYWWYASFASDTNNKAANIPCPSSVSTLVAASKSTPTVTIAAPSAATTGVAIPASSLSVTLSGGLSPTGTVTIYAYFNSTKPATCPGGAGWTTIGTLTPVGNGTYSPTVGLSSPATGTYWWYAAFAGDSTNNAANSLCNNNGMTKTTVAVFSGTVSSVSALDTNHNGRIDEIDVLFTVNVTCSATCTDGWTVSNVPSGGTLSSVTTSSKTAKLMITEGAGAQDTTAGTATVSLTAPGGITDSSGRYASFASTAAADKATPTAINVALANGTGTAGKADSNDTVTITYSEPLNPSKVCSAWGTSTTTNYSATGVTLTVNKSTQVMSITAAGTCTTWTGGTVSLVGSYATGSSNMTFTNSTLAWNAAARTLTITLGTLGTGTPGTSVAAAVPTYTATTTIQDAAANAMTTGPYSGTSSRF